MYFLSTESPFHDVLILMAIIGWNYFNIVEARQTNLASSWKVLSLSNVAILMMYHYSLSNLILRASSLNVIPICYVMQNLCSLFIYLPLLPNRRPKDSRFAFRAELVLAMSDWSRVYGTKSKVTLCINKSDSNWRNSRRQIAIFNVHLKLHELQ